ncbi:MAG: Calx-beta domain-containing protein [Verrucomicrobiota bacterium]|nr:hypothetical protein [Verrucomicrobiota bacterium]MDG1892307.1 Calx-beta domain-containing protein [Verrucomicrobiota bacterium]
MKHALRLLTIALLSLTTPLMHGQEVFADHFEEDTSSGWTILDDSLNGIPDATVMFAHDYTQDSYTLTQGAVIEQRQVPPNPFDEKGTTLGLKVMVNSDSNGSEASVSLYPKGLALEGDHALRFEMFMSYNGPAFGGSGSTEFATMGLGHSGELTAFLDGNLAIDGDGTFFAVSGEGGASRDYRAYTGDGFSEPEFLDEQSDRFGFTDIDHDGIGEYNVYAAGPLGKVLPFPPHETRGAPGKGWVKVEVRRVDNRVTWIINGHIIASIPGDLTLFGGDNVMIGYADPFASIANPGEENFVIFDNLRVVKISAGDALPVVQLETPGERVEDPENGNTIFMPSAVGEGDEKVTITLQRTGPKQAPLSVAYRLEGSATAGLDYRKPPTLEINFPPGSSETSVDIVLLDDTEEEQDETLELVLLPDDGYELANGRYIIIPIKDNGDSGLPEPELLADATVGFSEDFDEQGSPYPWTVNTSSADSTATFAYDYTIDGIPPAPGSDKGSTRGLKFTVNESLGAADHITASPNGQSFSGDYVLVFDLWLNINGPIPGGGAGSTEFASAGIGTSGDHIQTADEASDGAWFLLTGDGGSSRDVRFFLNNLFLTEDSGVYPSGSMNNSHPAYASLFVAGKSPPAAQREDFAQQTGETSPGQPAFEWIRVQLAKQGEQVTWTMNGQEVAVASQETGPFSADGNIFLGYSDWFSSVSDNVDLSFALFDNVKVYQLPTEEPLMIRMTASAGKAVIEFNGKLERASSVLGPWTPVTDAQSPHEIIIDPGMHTEFFRVIP